MALTVTVVIFGLKPSSIQTPPTSRQLRLCTTLEAVRVTQFWLRRL